MKTTHAVKIDPSFFSRAKLEYADWRWAFVREVIQNSVDAGATQIVFLLSESALSSAQHELKLVVKDNGTGMDRETLLNKFLAIGGTQKTEGAVGGFGYAKNIILFCHEKYSVQTGNSFIQGVGGAYDLTTCDPVVGTTITVTMKDDQQTASSCTTLGEALAGIIRQYVGFMSVPGVEVLLHYMDGPGMKINGLNLPQFQIKPGARALTYHGADLVYDKSDYDRTKLITCVRGLPMFVQSLPSQAPISGRINFNESSLDILTVNRDGLKSAHRGIVDELLNILTNDLSSLDRTALKTKYISINKTAEFSFDVDLDLELETYPNQLLVQIDYTSGNSVKTIRSLKTVLARSRTVRLLTRWSAVVKAMVDTLAECTNTDLSKLEVITGLVYGEDQNSAEAIYSRRGVQHAVLISPLHMERIASTSRSVNMHDLVDLAAHEVAHMIYVSHNEQHILLDAELRRKFRRMFNISSAGEVVRVTQEKTPRSKRKAA